MKHTQGQWTRYQESRNLQTRKHPRTLQEAFGPYTGQEIEDLPDPWDMRDVAFIWACVTCALVAFFFI